MKIPFLFILVLFSPVDSEFCRNTEYLNGRWEPLTPEEAMKKSYPCCAGHAVSVEHDIPKCQIQNEWPLYGKEMSGKIPRSMGHGCSCIVNALLDGKITNVNRLLPIQMYEWRPKGCEMVKWSAKQFCDVLGNRTILMVGDSTMQQTAVALFSRLVEEQAVCLSQVDFELSDNLVYSPFESRGANLIAQLSKHWSRILIFSVGPHVLEYAEKQYENRTQDSFMHCFYPKLKFDMEFIRQHLWKPDKIVYKTQNPGHFGCEAHNAPVDDVAKLQQEHQPSEYEYPWYLGSLVDERMIETLKDEPGFQVINMSPLDGRPDAHAFQGAPSDSKDCLHYCIPGALDLFAEILLHKMFIQEI